jgi:predicted PurR-regulated permease PerM
MALPVGTQLKYWTIAAVVLFAALWFLGDMILPFVLGGAVAYFLDPLADRLERMGMSRVWATVIITLLAVLVFLVVVLSVIPTLIGQAVALVNTAPALFHDLQAFLTERFPSLTDETSTIRQSLAAIGAKIQERGGAFLTGILSGAMSFINILLLLVVVPVVAFYMLLDWDRMIASIDNMLPRDHAPVIRNLAREIDRTLSSFVRGQATVCLILGTYYAVALMLIGLNFGLVVGAIAGLITFIPYVGALVGGALAIGLGLFQFWGEWWSLGGVAVVFVLGQMIEGNVLTPKLVGGSVGLHPVWLLFALAAFGGLFGFVGMLVAVPVAAAIGVIARFALAQYKDGRLYRGLSSGDQG